MELLGLMMGDEPHSRHPEESAPCEGDVLPVDGIVLDKGVTLERSAGQMGARLHVEIVEDEVEEFCR